MKNNSVIISVGCQSQKVLDCQRGVFEEKLKLHCSVTLDFHNGNRLPFGRFPDLHSLFSSVDPDLFIFAEYLCLCGCPGGGFCFLCFLLFFSGLACTKR